MHEVESMMYVGEVPWHGLGKKLEQPPTPREAIVMAGLDWEVRTEPLHMNVGGQQVSVPANATVRSTDNRVLGVVGPSYVPVQNVDAFDWFIPFIDEGLVTLETAGSLRGGKRVWILARVIDGTTDIVKGDPIERFVLLSNSHDGTLAVRAGFTATRVVCQNTLSYAHNSKASKLLRIRHTKNANEALKTVRDIMNVANEEFEASVEQMRALARYRVDEKTVAEYVRKVFNPKVVEGGANEEKDTTSSDRLVSKIVPLFESGRGNDLPGVQGTMWAAYNAVTEYLTHERGNDRDVRLDSQWFGDSAKLGMRALQVANKMALVA